MGPSPYSHVGYSHVGYFPVGYLHVRHLGVFEGWFKGRLSSARKAEVTGDLPRAVALYVEARRPVEAARVMILRGDSEPDARLRLQHYTQAVAMAPEGHATRRQAGLKRALLTLTLAGDAAVSKVARAEVLSAARELEALDENDKAAEAYALAGDKEAQARALGRSGDLDALEDLLVSEQTKDRSARLRQGSHSEIDLFMATGRRREALARATALSKAEPDDTAFRERASSILARKVIGPIVRITLNGVAHTLVLGEDVVIGRSEGSLTIASHAVSRRHLSLTRSGKDIVVRDLGSRNGTQLRGLALRGEVPFKGELALKLGGEVLVRVLPDAPLPGSVFVEVAGERFVAPLGPATLGIGDWTLTSGEDGWLELVTTDGPPALLDDVALGPRATLLLGDAISVERGGAPVLRVAG